MKYRTVDHICPKCFLQVRVRVGVPASKEYLAGHLNAALVNCPRCEEVEGIALSPEKQPAPATAPATPDVPPA